ncbi:MAG TPA: LysR family transcriptional regulator [Bosea sp. (in: a-proteobacteria)]|jgi:DNA-binding transcriptional LysR family regulator|uniref:LysR family transcriptional regulator n=1 Tax=Bosea sp. (in: a-proteobacteria) TaxID=1871050 RepID=UPI002E0F4CFF|nr:LysR family transcriptional regulator [Bosea sp. (in: a-proteobacteria)]
MKALTPSHATVLRAVERCGTTVEAARQLHLTQSAVSKIIARSEASLGIAVFDRRDGRLVLRPQARALLQALGTVEEEWRALRAAVGDLRSGRALPLRIASTPSIGQGLIAQAIRQLVTEYPAARIELIMGDAPTELSKGTADLGVMFSPRVTDDIALTPLAQASIIALVRDDDPLARRGSVSLPELKERRLICFDREKSPLGWLIARAHEEAGLNYAPFMTVPYSISAAHLLARQGDVILIDSLLTQAQPFEGLVKLRVTPQLPITICLMTVRSRPLTRLAARFAEILVNANAGDVV